MKQSAGYDLHSHSRASDGSLSPTELVQAAADAGVRLLALTDHDTLDGLAEARQAAVEAGIRLVDGIELTCSWNRRVIHLLGLGIDPQAPSWTLYLRRLRQLREARAEAIAARLVGQGLPDLLPEAQRLAGSASIGRPHFAQVMVDRGLVATPRQAFDTWLGQGRIGDVKAQWPELAEAVAQIKSSGGHALIAHPTKYKMTFTRLRQLAADLVAAGGDGVEVSYPGVTPNHLRDLLQMAERQQLWVSAGSDFHSFSQRWTALGRFADFTSERHLLKRLCPQWPDLSKASDESENILGRC